MHVNPCPFCGHADVEYSEVEPGRYAVDCPECQCIGPFADSTEDAAKRWNAAGKEIKHRSSVLAELCQRHESEIMRLRRRLEKVELP